MASEIDNELFIEEIRKRPALWDLSSKEYSNRNAKKNAWEEICTIFINGFENKTTSEKNKEGVKLQKKWKGFRDCHIKNKNKKIKSGSGASTSREYLYSHLLSFLDSSSRTRPLSPEVPISEDTASKKSKKLKTDAKSEDKLLEVLIQRFEKKDKDTVNNDIDCHFLMSLKDDLSSIHPEFKMDAKIELMSVIKKYKQMSNYSSQPHNSGYYTTGSSSSAVSQPVAQQNLNNVRPPRPISPTSSASEGNPESIDGELFSEKTYTDL